MSFLAPLFLAALAAVSAPILFHLIRRSPRGRVLFSSLMFLSPSPPRVTRRSRLEHWPLLLLRALAIVLLALAFARPFLWESTAADIDDAGPGRRTVLLIDASASMQRAKHWEQAKERALDIVKAARPTDRLALLAFDNAVRPLVSFEQWSATPVGERLALVEQALSGEKPGWAGTKLGDALIIAADALADLATRDGATDPHGAQQIVVLSDLQSGSDLTALHAYEWPQDVTVKLAVTETPSPTNAGLQATFDRDASQRDGRARLRLRVTNAADSTTDRFNLRFKAPNAAADRENADDNVASSLDYVMEAYVPAGESRVFSAPDELGDWAGDRVVLEGDDAEFDNVAFYLAPSARPVTIVYIGDDSATNADAPLYFLERACPSTRTRQVDILTQRPADPYNHEPSRTNLIVVSQPLPEAQATALNQAITDGATVIHLLRDAEGASTLASFTGLTGVEASEATVRDYAMWTDVDIVHPFFAPFADPRFSDFTKIRFWKHRSLKFDANESAHVLAKFDAGDPALLDVRVGRGRCVVFAAGWHPADSQLALSTKFVPLMNVILREALGGPAQAAQHAVGQRIDLSWLGRAITAADAASGVRVTKPDGGEVVLADEAKEFAGADQPGLYTVTAGARTERFAVNLSAAESDTAPMQPDQLEALGVRLASGDHRGVQRLAEQQRQLRIVELEDRQKLWRWLIVAALGVLVLETMLAGWMSGRATAAEAQGESEK